MSRASWAGETQQNGLIYMQIKTTKGEVSENGWKSILWNNGEIF